MGANGRSIASARMALPMRQRRNRRSDLYRDFLPAINSHMVDLLDDAATDCADRWPRTRAARGGKDSIDHAPNGTTMSPMPSRASSPCSSANANDLRRITVMGVRSDKDPRAPDPEWQQQRYANFIATGGYKRPW